MATSDEQFGEEAPYHPDMTTLAAADLLRLGLADSGGATAGGCLDEVALAAMVDGSVEGEARAASIRHVAGCTSCRRQLAALIALSQEPAVAAEVARVQGGGLRLRRPLLSALGVAAAAAVLFLVVWPRRPATEADEVRDPTITAATAPVGLEPVGAVRDARALIWGRVDGASSYRATLFDSTGTVLFEARLADTAVTIPDSVTLVPRQAYFWKVETRTGWDRWTASELFEFRVDSTARPQANQSVPAPTFSGAAYPAGVARDSAAPALLSDDQLVRGLRAGTVDVRNSFRETLAAAVRGDSASRAGQLRTAARLAATYQAAWRDDFLTRELARFIRWSPGQRAAKVSADSLRVAGNAVYGRAGPLAAVAVWRRALVRALAIPDSAGSAALLGNIGAVLAGESRLDSAVDYLRRAQRLADAVGDLRVTANAVSELAGVSEERGDVDAARTLYAQAIELRGRIGDSRGLAADYNNIASLSRAAGAPDQARQQLEAALALNRRDGRLTAAATNLVNLASLAASVGAFARADEDYREALSTWLTAGDSAEAASALTGLGDLGLRRGDYPEAVRHFTAAARILDRTGPAAEALMVRQRLAAALAAQGQLQQAVDVLRRAQQTGESLEVTPDVRGSTALARADLAMQLNQYHEAEELYARAIALYSRGEATGGVPAARHGLGMLYLAQNDPARAGTMLESALRSQIASRDRRGAAVTRLALADAAVQAGDSARARTLLKQASDDLHRLGDAVASAAALNQRAELEVDAGRFAAAESLYRTALARLKERIAPDIGWRIHAGLAEARANLGGLDEAAKLLRASIAEIEGMGSTLRLPERRSGLLLDKWAVYQQLAAVEIGRGRVDASFAVSEALRAREMVELLSLGRVAPPRDTAADLVVREQDLRRRITELTRVLEGDAPDRRLIRGPEVVRSGAASREELLQAQAAYTALRLQIRERAPRHAALVSPEAVTWRMVAGKLRRDEAMLEYLLSEEGSFVYVITRDTLAAVPLPATQRELGARIAFVRGALQPRGGSLDSLWRAPLRQLHRDLIAPVEGSGLLSGKTRLVIVPHAELHYLPFAALIERDGAARFLIQRYQLSFTPSASVWMALSRNRNRSSASGMLALAPNLDRLPASRREIAAIARAGGGDVRVLTGSGASEAAFLKEAPGKRVIHLATYGVLNKENPLFSFIDLVSDGRNDGRLEAHEVFGLSLVADLVVLAACQTALASGAQSDVPPGDDWVGLSRAFLSAGAKSVIASLWAVQDRATATLMQRFYERYDGAADPGRTLAEAQRAMLAVPGTAHPYYWAGFEVIGGK